MDWTDPRTSQAASAAPIEKQPENPEIQCCNNVIPLGANARQLRFGGGGHRSSRLATYQTLSNKCSYLYCARACMRHSSVLYMGSVRVYTSHTYLSFLEHFGGFSLYFCRFCCVVYVLCSRSSFVEVPLMFSSPADHTPDWQPRIYIITGYG